VQVVKSSCDARGAGGRVYRRGLRDWKLKQTRRIEPGRIGVSASVSGADVSFPAAADM